MTKTGILRMQMQRGKREMMQIGRLEIGDEKEEESDALLHAIVEEMHCLTAQSERNQAYCLREL